MSFGNMYLTMYVAVKNESHIVNDTIQGFDHHSSKSSSSGKDYPHQQSANTKCKYIEKSLDLFGGWGSGSNKLKSKYC